MNILYFVTVLTYLDLGRTQISWTPIYVDGNSQVDLWTHDSSGCRCSFDSKRQDCACCAKDGGCPCGRAVPHRCTQCGLEDYCGNLCNATIDSRILSARSGKTFGQIKSPSIEGPSQCWYLMQPLPGQRVELQVYRLISVGRFNGTNCQGGFLQLVDGSDPTPRQSEAQICGGNERFAPPVVLFADKGAATLIFQVTEATVRSQFLAYFSFTSITGAQGFPAKGGRRIEHTECDWLYQDFACRSAGSCVLVSPGYPGVYPPNRHCKYLITTSSILTRVRISFVSLLLPPNHCGTDYIAIYQGSTSSGLLLTTLCANKKQDLTFSGPNLLLEFSSGPPVPPYDYNGFRATLEFSEKPTSTESSINSIIKSTETGLLMDGTSAPKTVVQSKSGCDMFFSGNVSRSGTFDTRGRSWNSACTFTFVGRPADIVHVSLFNYNLKAMSCQSSIEMYDGLIEEGIKPIKKICSPVTKHARDYSTGRFVEKQTFLSSDNTMSILLKRSFLSPFQLDTDFVDGAFLFHDEQVDGTLQPSTLCDVEYYGLSSSSHGQVSNPGTQDLYFNIERALRCSQRFIPAANQSITLTVNNYNMIQVDTHCHTQCGDSGCRCVASLLPLAQVDHLLILADGGQTLSCLCGEFQQEWLPVTIQSWSPVRLVYSVAHYSWETKGFNFTASYTFTTDGACGHYTLTQPQGSIETVRIIPDGQLNYYYHKKCTWLLDTKIERQLSLEIHTAQNRPCSAWNVTFHHYDENSSDRTGEQIQVFCPRDRHKKYHLPWKTDLVVVKLEAMTHTPPEFTLHWSSLVVRSNTRMSDPIPAPSAPSTILHPSIYLIIIIMFSCFVS